MKIPDWKKKLIELGLDVQKRENKISGALLARRLGLNISVAYEVAEYIKESLKQKNHSNKECIENATRT